MSGIYASLNSDDRFWRICGRIAVAGVWISYVLLSPVSKSLILLDVFFTLVSLAVEAVSKLFLLLVLPILSTTGYQTHHAMASRGSHEPRWVRMCVQVSLPSTKNIKMKTSRKR
jgi:hypothetical protein